MVRKPAEWRGSRTESRRRPTSLDGHIDAIHPYAPRYGTGASVKDGAALRPTGDIVTRLVAAYLWSRQAGAAWTSTWTLDARAERRLAGAKPRLRRNARPMEAFTAHEYGLDYRDAHAAVRQCTDAVALGRRQRVTVTSLSPVAIQMLLIRRSVDLVCGMTVPDARSQPCNLGCCTGLLTAARRLTSRPGARPSREGSSEHSSPIRLTHVTAR